MNSVLYIIWDVVKMVSCGVLERYVGCHLGCLNAIQKRRDLSCLNQFLLFLNLDIYLKNVDVNWYIQSLIQTSFQSEGVT